MRGSLVAVLAALGEREAAKDRLHEIREQAESGKGSAGEVACGYLALGEDDLAYSWLDRGFEALVTRVGLRPLPGPPSMRSSVATETPVPTLNKGILTRRAFLRSASHAERAHWTSLEGDIAGWLQRRELPKSTPALAAPPGEPFGS